MKYSVLAAIMNHLGIEDNEDLPANGHLQLQDIQILLTISLFLLGPRDQTLSRGVVALCYQLHWC